ncbi:hypothetical protein BpHYR1_027677 [Brachionus plicatilis]|uniref:Uncharacterized protein n=1 Tax=Brachionus plicatilis TaxID=10195 RepID=A0A3M7QDY1_BRAPC|nr:hypothetical protein BpHYR1_027677 [Brachionus plicatilis]
MNKLNKNKCLFFFKTRQLNGFNKNSLFTESLFDFGFCFLQVKLVHWQVRHSLPKVCSLQHFDAIA